MSAFVIADITVNDPERYEEYKKLAPPPPQNKKNKKKKKNKPESQFRPLNSACDRFWRC